MSTKLKVYHISTYFECDGNGQRQTIAYATGRFSDIKNFYSGRETYDLHIDEINIENITPKKVREKKELQLRKYALEKDKKDIENSLKKLNGGKK